MSSSSAREELLGRVRTALGRSAGQPVPEPPPLRLVIPEMDQASRIASFRERLEALNGKVRIVATPAEAKPAVEEILNGRTAIASNAQFLVECGIPSIAQVQSGIRDREALKAACATANFGITSTAYALAATGTLATLASEEEPRLISLLPPAHIVVIPASRILVNLDELFTRVPMPASATSALVFITGPSRTADIEQILVRGVHGPGEIHAVIVENA